MQSYNQSPSQPSSSLRCEKVCMSGFSMAQRKFLSYPRTNFSIKEHLSNKFKNTSKESKKEVFIYELEGYFSSIKKINWCQQVLTPNWHPFHNLPQSWRGGGVLISSLYTSHRKISNTPEEKFHDQRTMIRKIYTNESTIDHVPI